MSLIFVDVEAYGGAPSVGKMTEFGAVEYQSRESFHGVIWKSSPDPANPAIPLPTELAVADPGEVFRQFDHWLQRFKGPYVFVSDNNGFDWQWINDGFWKFLGRNPFGHSSRRISDFYAGLCDNFFTPTQNWKRLRRTVHDHNPVNDAMGNAEAFERMLNGER
jgi:hypothetical protein